jgi:hypothetical protein
MKAKVKVSRRLAWVFSCAILLAGTFTASVRAQIRYTRGQDVGPTYDGWERNPDGTYNFYFGYLNRNSEESLDIPTGPENTFDLGNGDQGQPTHFYPGRRWWVFKVVVPKDWPKDKRLVWTLTSRGRTNQAKGWLEPEWEVDKQLIAKNSPRDPFLSSGGSGQSSDDNQAPSITGGPAQTITLPATATLAVTATDDGIPKPIPDPAGRSRQGLRIRWIVYRGSGTVQFNPEITEPVYGKPIMSETKVSFSAPGKYRLRAIALDGELFSTYDIDVTVNPSR